MGIIDGELCEEFFELDNKIEELRTQRNEALMLLVRCYHMIKCATCINFTDVDDILGEVETMLGETVASAWPKGWDLSTTLVELKHLDE